jgi:hypothetical protein
MSIYYAFVKGDLLDRGDNSQVAGENPGWIQVHDGQSREQVYLSDEVRRAACQSFGVVVVGAGISDYLRGRDDTIGTQGAVSSDIVIWECSQHPRVLTVYARRCEYIDGFSEAENGAVTGFAEPPAANYGEQFRLRDATGVPIANAYYTVALQGALNHGANDFAGCISFHQILDAKFICICLDHKQEA